MATQKQTHLWVSELEGYLNGKLYGEDFQITQGIHQIRSTGEFGNIARLPRPTGDWVLIAEKAGTEASEGARATIVVDAPEHAFISAIKEFFTIHQEPVIHPTAQISAKARLGKNVAVGAYSVIGDDVEIGKGVVIQNHCTIYGPTIIGPKAIIMDGAVLGNSPYRFVEGESGELVQPMQIGKIFIEEGVWIGSNSTIERSFYEDTTIRRQAKIDGLVNIGGGSDVGENTMITAGCVIGSQVVLGRQIQLGMTVSIKPGVSIHQNVIIGQGAVVINNITSEGTYIGTPAKLLTK